MPRLFYPLPLEYAARASVAAPAGTSREQFGRNGAEMPSWRLFRSDRIGTGLQILALTRFLDANR